MGNLFEIQSCSLPLFQWSYCNKKAGEKQRLPVCLLQGREGKGTNGVKTEKNAIVQNDESKNDKACLKFSKKKGRKPAKTPGRGKQNPSFPEKKKRVWKGKEKNA
ncbi:MAG: hypothetical protein MR910_04870 [Clostridiales bacterium]|nr:hypothetical protein [Clostridiales bacterium]